MTSSLPFEPKTEKEWIALHETDKKPVNVALKAAGVLPAQYLQDNWTAEMKAKHLVEFQKKHGWGAKDAPKADKADKKEKKAAASAPAPEPEAKKKSAAAPATPAAASGEKKFSDIIIEQLAALHAKVDALLELTRDGHLVTKALATSDGDALELAKNDRFREGNYGVLLAASPAVAQATPEEVAAEEEEEDDEDEDDEDEDEEGNDD
jgi:hypothetical protein